MGFFDKIKSLFARTPEQLIEVLNRGLYPCAHCKQETRLDQLVPLSFGHCPKCNDLFLVPHLMEDWWVIEPLGAGGMGAVYLARHKTQPSAKAAVKLLQQAEGNQSFLDQLVQEATIAASFGRHPKLAQVYAYGYGTHDAYMIMQMIDGKRLDKLVKEKGHIDEELCLWITLDILDSIEHIYDCGYLYRDLKPENILLQQNGVAVTVDYGLCMLLHDALIFNGDDIMGSPLYMPPERITASGEDLRSDLYSLGMVLYYLLNGDTYFSPTDINKIVQRQIGGLRVSVSGKCKYGSEHTANLIDGLIRLNPNERYSSYAEVRSIVISILNELMRRPALDPQAARRRTETPI